MMIRGLALLGLLLPAAAGEDEVSPLAADPSVAAHVLNSARKELKTARDNFKRLSPDERGVIKRARETVATRPEWRALAQALGGAADLLEGASDLDGAAAALCGHMAKTYRAMAEVVDEDESYLTEELKGEEPGERAEKTFAEAEKLLTAAGEAAIDEGATEAWGLIKRGDPMWRAFALNMKTLARGYATLGEAKHAEKLAAAIGKAAKLHAALEPHFVGVRTKWDAEPEEEPEPESGRTSGIFQRVG